MKNIIKIGGNGRFWEYKRVKEIWYFRRVVGIASTDWDRITVDEMLLDCDVIESDGNIGKADQLRRALNTAGLGG